MQPQEALRAFVIPGHPAWYTIGFGESRVTVHTQQLRALNLAWALNETGHLADGPVVVIGGGAAGLTVAAGLAHFGAAVTVLEKEDFLLPLQRHCYKRHLHPHIFDWPEAGADNAFADLPLLNWKAGMAREVAFSIEAAFEELRFEHKAKGTGSLNVRLGVKDVTPDGVDVGRVAFRDQNHFDTVPYGILVFALGFGVEDDFWAGQRGSYWSDDNLDQHGVFLPGHYLVSGIGDGGLIDTLRILTRDFRQEDFARIVQNATNFSALRDALLRIEAEAKSAAPANSGTLLHDAYADLSSELVEPLDRRLGEKINREVHVTLVATAPSPFSLASRPLHRFLLSRLLFRFARVLTIRPNMRLAPGMLRHDGHRAVLALGDDQTFDHVVLRHGPKNAFRQFPDVAESLKKFERKAIGHRPLYDPRIFGTRVGRGGPIAWSTGPHEADYLDTIKAHVSFVNGVDGSPISLDRFGELNYEVRETPSVPTSSLPGRTPADVEPSDQPPVDDERRKQEDRWKEEAQQLHTERYWRRIPGLSIRAASYRMESIALLSGRAGVGKTTFLKIIAREALTAHRGDAAKPFPVWITGPLDLEVDGERVPGALADAAVRTAEMASFSRAASFIQSKLRRREAVVFLDAVDGWNIETMQSVTLWLRHHRIPALLAARRFSSTEFGAFAQTWGVHHYELLGLSPRSAKRFIEIHAGDESVAPRLLDELRHIANSQDWLTNPFLLTLALASLEATAVRT